MRLNAMLALVFLVALQASPQVRELRGTATLEGGGVPAGVSAVMFPADEQRWSDPKVGDISRLAPLANGAFVISLPPGAYRLGFTSQAGAKDFPSPALFARLVSAGALPIELPAATQIEAVLAPAGGDFRLLTAKVATVGTMTTPARGTSVAPSGRGGPPVAPAPGGISGRVLDHDGKPLAGIEVRTMRPRLLNGQVDYLPVGQAVTTGPDGRYLAANRAPGDYIVAAAPYALDLTSQARQSVRRAPASSVDADGVRRGYVVSFCPATDDHSQAAVIKVGQTEVAGIDITLVRKPVFELRGRIDGSFNAGFGFPPAVTVFATNLGAAMTGNLQRRVPVAQDGAFAVPDLPEGDVVVAFSGPAGWAREQLNVSAKTSPLTLSLRPPMSVTGSVEFHGDAPRPQLAAPARGVSTPVIPFVIQLTSVQPEPGTSGGFQPGAAEATFVANASGPGPFRLRATYPAPWIQVSGFVDGIDTLDVPLPFGPASTDARVVMADRPTTLVINVRDANDAPLPNVLVALFADDERYWVAGSRRAHAGPSSAVATATFTGLPAGKYLVAIAPELPANAVASAALFRRLVARATPVELALRESRSITVQAK